MRRPSPGWLAACALATWVTGAAPADAGTEPARGPEGEATAARLDVGFVPEAPTVGDRVTATLVLTALPDGAGEPRFPVWRSEWGGAEILDARAPERLAGGWRQQLVLAFFSPGEHVLPVVSVQVPGAQGTREVTVTRPVTVLVRSVLPEGGAAEPAPAAPPRPLPLGAPFLWLAGVLGLGCVAVAAALARRRTDDGAAAGPPPAPPLEELLARLDRTDPAGDPVGTWERSALALRRYLGRALGFPAAESTTLEIQRLLARRLAAEPAGRTVRLLRAADQVKFARRPASATDAAGLIAEIAALAREIEDRLRPQPAGDEEAA